MTGDPPRVIAGVDGSPHSAAALEWAEPRRRQPRSTDPVLETVVALVTPYAAYVLAEALDVSGGDLGRGDQRDPRLANRASDHRAHPVATALGLPDGSVPAR